MKKARVATVQAEWLAERLATYRTYVSRAAAGQPLRAESPDELGQLMQALGLPPYAWRRDVQATAQARSGSSLSCEELVLFYPHLFDEPGRWVDERIRAVERMQHRAGKTE